MSCFIKSKGDPRKPKVAKKKKKSVHWFCLAPADGLSLFGPSALHHQAELVRQSSRSKPLPMLVLRIRWQMPGVWEAEGHINTASLHICFFILSTTRHTAHLFIYLLFIFYLFRFSLVCLFVCLRWSHVAQACLKLTVKSDFDFLVLLPSPPDNRCSQHPQHSLCLQITVALKK